MSLLAKLGSSMGARVAMAALNYGLFWQLSHRLPPAALGGFSTLMNLFFLVQLLPMLGVSNLVIRRTATEIADEPEALRREFATALVFALPVAVLIALLVLADGWFEGPVALRDAVGLLALSMLPTAAILVIESLLLGREQMTVVARIECIEAAVRTLASVAAVMAGAGLTAVFAVFAASRLGCLVLYLWRGGLPWPRWRDVDRELWRLYWRHVPVFLSIVALAAVVSRIDVLMLSRLRPLEDVAVYAAAARLYDAALMLPTVAALVVMPTLARQFQVDPVHFHAQLARAVRAGLVVGVLPALLVAALSEPIIELLYAPALVGAVPVLRVLIFGAVLMTVDQMLSSTMVAARAQAEDLRTMVVAAVTLLGGLFLIVPGQGPLGAAMAVLLALLMRVGWRLRWVLRSAKVPGFLADLLRWALCVAAAVAALALGLRWHALTGALAGIATYLAALRLAGLIGPHSWRAALATWHGLRGRTTTSPT